MRGPYSKGLTADAFEILHCEAPDGWKVDDATKQKLNHAKQLIDQAKATPEPARELEKIASVLFVIKTQQGTTCDEIEERLKVAGKNFTRQEVEEAITTLQGFCRTL